MSFAYLPLYTGDYLRDTRACSMSEHGAYMLLLIYCWDTREPVPLDEREAAGICNARSGDELEAMRRVLNRYFVRCDDGWYNQRLQREIERAESISHARSIAGQRGYQARVKQLPSKSLASASIPNPIPTSTPTPSPSSGDVSPETPLLAQARALLAFLNDKTGRNFRQTEVNLRLIVARLKEGYSEQDCRSVVARKVREWIHDDMMAKYLRPATLFNREKFNQYAGEFNAKMS